MLKVVGIIFDLLTWISGIITFTTLFNWFVVPITHAETIGYLHGYGVMLTWLLIRARRYDTEKLDDDEELSQSISNFIYVLIILALGTIVHAFM